MSCWSFPAQETCARGCGEPVCSPSRVLCKACRDELDTAWQSVASRFGISDVTRPTGAEREGASAPTSTRKPS